MKITAIRHGQSNYNVMGLCNSDPNKDVHLTKTGLQQADQAATTLKTYPLEVIYTSQLPRTHQTARIVNRHHQLDIKEDGRLNDRQTGFEDQAATKFTNAIKSSEDPISFKYGDGESLLTEKKRVFNFLNELTSNKSYGHVLLVTHSDIMAVIYGYFNNLADIEIYNLPGFANCQIIDFEC